MPRIACAAFAAAGSVSVAVGSVLSSCHVQLAGEPSTLPARSTARICIVWLPSIGVTARLCGLVQVVQPPPSRLHSIFCVASLAENVKLGCARFVGSPGFVSIVVSGAVRSTVTAAIELLVWPTMSVATASIQYEPSAGSVHEEL